MSILSPSTSPGHLLSPPAFRPTYPIGVTEHAPVAAGLSYHPNLFRVVQRLLIASLDDFFDCLVVRMGLTHTMSVPWHGHLEDELLCCRSEEG